MSMLAFIDCEVYGVLPLGCKGEGARVGIIEHKLDEGRLGSENEVEKAELRGTHPRERTNIDNGHYGRLQYTV